MEIYKNGGFRWSFKYNFIGSLAFYGSTAWTPSNADFRKLLNYDPNFREKFEKHSIKLQNLL